MPPTPAQTIVRAWRLWLYWRGAVAVSATSLLAWAHYELLVASPEKLRLGVARPTVTSHGPSDDSAVEHGTQLPKS